MRIVKIQKTEAPEPTETPEPTEAEKAQQRLKEVERDQNISQLAHTISTDRQNIKKVNDAIKANQEKLKALMGELERLNVPGYNGRDYEVVVVSPSSMILDEQMLRKKIGVKAWNRITNRVIDSALLKEAMESGLVDALDVAACTNEKNSNPYVKITEKKPPNMKFAEMLGTTVEPWQQTYLQALLTQEMNSAPVRYKKRTI